ncbi:MAG: glycosyltransferase family 9 protein [Candidatus Aminicenantia bacterium]
MNYSSILVVKMSSLGDIIHTLPAFRKLREHFPTSRIGWVVEKKGSEILHSLEGLDEIIIFDTLKWRRRPLAFQTFKEIKEALKKIKDNYDIALDFQGTLKSSVVTYLSSAKERIGFHKDNLRERISSVFYTKTSNKIQENTHVILKNLRLLEVIGINDTKPEYPNFKIRANLPDGFKIDKSRLIIINGGGGWETKTWVKGRWRELALRIREMGYEPLFLWGNEKERERMEEESKEDIPLTPFLTIPQVMKLISSSLFLISGDTFALHVSEALGIPVVGLYGPSNPSRNGPVLEKSKVVFHELPCSFCYKGKCKKLDCMKKIEVDAVMEKVKEILEK